MNSRLPADAGPVVAVGGLVLGIIAGERAGPAHAMGALVGGACVVVVAAMVDGWARVVLMAFALALLGAALTQRALDGEAHTSLASWRDAHELVVMRGTLASDPNATRFTTDVLVRVTTMRAARDASSVRRVDRVVLARAAAREASALRVTSMGDRVVLSGRLEALDGFDARLRWRHAVARLAGASLEEYRPPGSPLYRIAGAFRALTMRGAAGLSGRDHALFAGFLLGDTRDVPDPLRAAFRDAGLSHLLAVSGANVAFILALAGPVLRRTRLGMRALLGGLIVLMFATATRFEPSVLRASVMAAVAMAAMLAGRPVRPLRLLSIAVAMLLLADPFLLHSVGFLLSVGATAGIACCSAPIARRLRGPRWFRDTLAVTLAAQIGAAPVLLPVFGAMPAVTPLANLLAVPVAEPVTVYGLLVSFAIALCPPLRGAAHALQLPTAIMLRWVAAVATNAARVHVTIHAPAAFAGTIAVGACTAAIVLRRGATLRGDAPIPVPDAASR